MSHKMASLQPGTIPDTEEEEINRYVSAELKKFGKERYLKAYYEARSLVDTRLDAATIRERLIVKPQKIVPSQDGETPKISKAHYRAQKAFREITRAAIEHAIHGKPPSMPRGY
jgi:hypothetical protein